MEGLSRAGHLARIRGGRFDVLVVGGGITGAGIAWDCALRGFSVALLERGDFAAWTSAASSKMVHAGLRYMVNDPQLVEEAAAERRWIFTAGAHLARPLEYLVPVYPDTPEYDARALPAILERYDRLAGDRPPVPHRLLDPAEVLRRIPGLRPGPLLVGSYWDGVMDDARLTLEVIRSAADAGGAVLNHAPVVAFLKDVGGRVRGARFRDEAPGAGGREYEVSAAAVVGAAGPGTDLLLRMDAGGRVLPPTVRPSKGVHLLFRSSATGGRAVVIPMGDNILTFLVPFLSEYLIMGTTDTDYPVRDCADLDRVPAAEGDVRYNLDPLARVFPGVFHRRDIVACYAGVRPLLRPEPVPGRTVSESDTSRTHRIWRTPSGLWAIAGGKLTTFRLMAEQLVDRLAADFRERGRGGHLGPCTTLSRRLHASPGDGSWVEETAPRVAREADLPADVARQLCSSYGTAVDGLVERVRADRALAGRIGAGRPWILAEVGRAVGEEMCLTVEDFLVRRTALRFTETQGLDAAEAVADRLAEELGWPEELRRGQVQAYRDTIGRVWLP